MRLARVACVVLGVMMCAVLAQCLAAHAAPCDNLPAFTQGTVNGLRMTAFRTNQGLNRLSAVAVQVVERDSAECNRGECDCHSHDVRALRDDDEDEGDDDEGDGEGDGDDDENEGDDDEGEGDDDEDEGDDDEDEGDDDEDEGDDDEDQGEDDDCDRACERAALDAERGIETLELRAALGIRAIQLKRARALNELRACGATKAQTMQIRNVAQRRIAAIKKNLERNKGLVRAALAACK